MNAPGLYIADLGLILSLYAVQALLFRHLRSGVAIFGAYCAAIALAVSVTWLTSPDWNNELALRISVWVGTPVALLSVPVASFLFNLLSGHRGLRFWYIRIPIEVLLLVPIWFALWFHIMLSFGWVTDV
jgi:hypothetical protein